MGLSLAVTAFTDQAKLFTGCSTKLKTMGKMLCVVSMATALLSLKCLPGVSGEGLKASSRWTVRPGMTASDAQLFSHARSKVDCALHCQRFSHCAAFTFDLGTHTCSLYAVQKPQTTIPGQRTLSTIFWNSNPSCEEADIGNGTTSWNSTLTSLHGDVTCNPDFMYTSIDTHLRCLDDGTWENPIGQCMQYYWKNTKGIFLIPRPVFPGWAMCVRGKPTANDRFRGGTRNTTDHSVLYAGMFMSTQQIRVKMDKDNSGLVLANAHPFPFRLGQFFNLTFALVDADHTYTMAINGLEFIQRRSVQAISEVVKTYFTGDVEMDYVNVWCL